MITLSYARPSVLLREPDLDVSAQPASLAAARGLNILV
jgi:hypothetical protein